MMYCVFHGKATWCVSIALLFYVQNNNFLFTNWIFLISE